MREKIIYAFFVLPVIGVAQTVNEGDISVGPGTEVSTYFDFKNEVTGNVQNDGDFYFYGHYQNEGLFSYTKNSTTGYVVFEGLMPDMQNITGQSPSDFYDVLFNKSGNEHAFHLTNDVASAGRVNFNNGVVLMDKPNGGGFMFLKGADHINVKDLSHVDGEVNKVGNEQFNYPIGDGGYYRLAGISAPSNVKDLFVGKYILDDHQFFNSRPNTAGVIEVLNKREYWLLDQGNNTTSEVMVTLSWDERTTPAELLTDPEKELHIVYYDAKEQMWVDQGGVVDMSTKTISTPVVVKGYGFFTLATVKKDWLLDGGVVIYNLVSPNGDGKNDYFVIDGIRKYPNNKVEIFNRWGVKVYETTGYDSLEANNVFRGYSQGRVTVDKNEKLPSGTYFYIVSYEYTDASGSGSRMIKESGYLHLESN